MPDGDESEVNSSVWNEGLYFRHADKPCEWLLLMSRRKVSLHGVLGFPAGIAPYCDRNATGLVQASA